MSTGEYFRHKLTKMSLLNENITVEGIDNQVMKELQHIDNESLKDKVKSFYLTLLNDINLLLRLNLNQDLSIFTYMQNKVAFELKGPALELELQQIALSALTKCTRTNSKNQHREEDIFTDSNSEVNQICSKCNSPPRSKIACIHKNRIQEEL